MSNCDNNNITHIAEVFRSRTNVTPVSTTLCLSCLTNASALKYVVQFQNLPWQASVSVSLLSPINLVDRTSNIFEKLPFPTSIKFACIIPARCRKPSYRNTMLSSFGGLLRNPFAPGREVIGGIFARLYDTVTHVHSVLRHAHGILIHLYLPLML